MTWEHVPTRRAISSEETIETINPRIGGLFKYEVQKRFEEGDRTTFTLIIRRLRQNDAGMYKCSVRISGVDPSGWATKLGSLTVQVAPTIRTGETTSVLQVEKGGNSTLRCGAFGIPSPNITWTRSDGGLLPIIPPVAQFRSSQLYLVNVNVNHMGVYRCVADNYIKPPAVHLSEVLVFHAPTTRVVQNSVGQARNRRFDVKLECIVQGHPQPVVTWYRKEGDKEMIPIKDEDKYDINKQTVDNQNLKSNEQWYTLKIKNVQADDYKYDYYCVGENSYGRHSSVIVVFETTECQGPNCGSPPPSASASLPISWILLLLAAILSLLKTAC